MTKQEIIEDAIRNKKEIVGVYNDKVRQVSPHKLGWKNKPDGEKVLQVLCYQFEGLSTSEQIREGKWRCLTVEKFTRLHNRKGEFHTGELQGGRQTCIDDIICELE